MYTENMRERVPSNNSNKANEGIPRKRSKNPVLNDDTDSPRRAKS